MSRKNDVGHYLYGIIKGEIEGGSIVSHKGISGVISKVSLDEFSEQALKENLKSLDWVKENVLKHESIIEGVMKKTTIIPMKFCTIFTNLERIQELLREKHSYFTRLLERFNNKHEWGIKIYSSTKKEAKVAAASGREYLFSKKLELVKYIEYEQKINTEIEEIFGGIKDIVEDMRMNRPALKEQLVNASVLVTDNNVNKLIEFVKQKRELRLELSGPMPVYSFIGGLDADNE